MNINCTAAVYELNKETNMHEHRQIEGICHGFFQFVDGEYEAYPVALVEELPGGQIHEVIANSVKLNRNPSPCPKCQGVGTLEHAGLSGSTFVAPCPLCSRIPDDRRQ